MALHPKEFHLWIRAAKWEYEDNGNINAARTLIQQGMKHGATHRPFWLAFFKMELSYIRKLKKRKKVLGLDHGERPLDGKTEAKSLHDKFLDDAPLAVMLVERASRAMPDDHEILVQFLHLLPSSGAEFKHIRKLIYARLERFDAPAVVSLLAHRAYKKQRIAEGSALTVKAEQALCNVLERSLQRAPSAAAYELYVSSLLTRLAEDKPHTACKEFLLKQLLDVVQRARGAKLATSAVFRGAIDGLLLCDDTARAVIAAEQWTKAQPTGAAPWIAFARTVRARIPGAKGMLQARLVLQRGLGRVSPSDLPAVHVVLLRDRLRECPEPTRSDVSAIRKEFRSAVADNCLSRDADLGEIRASYLAWSREHDAEKHLGAIQFLPASGRCSAQMYRRLHTELMEGFVHSRQRESTRVRLLEKAVLFHGKSDVDVWVLYHESADAMGAAKLGLKQTLARARGALNRKLLPEFEQALAESIGRGGRRARRWRGGR